MDPHRTGYVGGAEAPPASHTGRPERYPSQSRIVDALAVAANDALEATQGAQSIAVNEATSEERNAEGNHDTRATEASYLARG